MECFKRPAACFVISPEPIEIAVLRLSADIFSTHIYNVSS